MDIPESVGKFLASFIQTIKTESIEWQKKYQIEQLKLKEERAIAEQQVKQKLEEMEIRFRAYRDRVQMEETQRTMDFEEYLKSLDELKGKIIEYYANMPKPLALMIHHHATQLLIEAWHNPDALERSRQQRKFLELMMTVTEEMSQLGSSDLKVRLLPEKTLDLIKKDI